jgi:hypothetical protein
LVGNRPYRDLSRRYQAVSRSSGMAFRGRML